ncbi:MAG: 50S ribosome-binding GTPase [Rhodobacteraceae bacterium]|nr:50S ribosome-binding GTPase [Paracoccaceae bacterium]
MTGNSAPLIEQLDIALGNKDFPASLHKWGRQLVSHLRKPVQVAVVGLPNSGKSALINMMLGQHVIPRLEGVSVVEVAGGADLRTMFETEDGSITWHSGLLMDLQVPAGTIRARQELPDLGLSDQNFVEINLPGDFDYQKLVVNRVTKWADIVLWCSENFDSTEQRLWMDVPEETKDHSCLVLTKADQQLMRGVLSNRISALEDFVTKEFLGLYPIATIQAMAARNSSNEFNAQQWKSSGGKELFECVMRQIQSGRTADLDQVQNLLNYLPPEITTPGRNTAAAVSSIAKDDPEQQVNPEKTKDFRSLGADAQNDQLLDEASKFLQFCADDMFKKLTHSDEMDPDQVLDQCVRTANALADLLEDVNPGNSSVKEVQDDVLETSELMMLLKLEKGEEAAVDAVTLLLQMKKEISAHSEPKVENYA